MHRGSGLGFPLAGVWPFLAFLISSEAGVWPLLLCFFDVPPNMFVY